MPRAEEDAVKQALQQYPWLRRLGAPISLTQGNGPYESESYLPHEEDNPTPGHFTVQLRSEKAKQDISGWPSILASESLDYLSQRDPTYQRFAKQFLATMTPDQLNNVQQRYQREKKEHQEDRSFQDYLRDVDVQEYMRGYLFPRAAPGWTGPNGKGKYTLQQIQLFKQLQQYLGAQ